MIAGDTVDVDSTRCGVFVQGKLVRRKGPHWVVELLKSGKRVTVQPALIHPVRKPVTVRKAAVDTKPPQPRAKSAQSDFVRSNIDQASKNLGARVPKQVCSYAGPRHRNNPPYWGRAKYVPAKLNPHETAPPRNERGNLNFGDHVWAERPGYLDRVNERLSAEAAAKEEQAQRDNQEDSTRTGRSLSNSSRQGGEGPVWVSHVGREAQKRATGGKKSMWSHW
eukprot:TRINITY_DN8204_c0_g1_i2.p1 TRINITY_DN8204_c0_g1~~TRINITY_DN8204_c0_g1_i2.p1  ORF type:complete len:222 (+),score=40.68 TRINITY_DN8204_c0_g1_i2:223-888(+)